MSVQKLEPCPTQALAFGVSDKGSGRPAVSQAPGIDDRFTVTCSCGQPLLGSAQRGRVQPPELGDPGLQVRSDRGMLGSGSDRRSDLLREGDEHTRER